MTFWTWWESKFLARERAACFVAAAALAVLIEALFGAERLDHYLSQTRFTVFPQLAALLGALLGLVIAAGAIVLDRVAEGRLAIVADSRHGADLWATMKSAMWALGLSTILALVVLVPSSSAMVDRVVVYVWTFSALLVAARLARTVWIVGWLMDIVAAQEAE